MKVSQFFHRMILTSTLVVGIAMGSLLSGSWMYGWGVRDGATLHIGVPCGHEHCAKSVRSPLFPLAKHLLKLGIDLPAEAADDYDNGQYHGEYIELRLLVPADVAREIEAEAPRLEPVVRPQPVGSNIRI